MTTVAAKTAGLTVDVPGHSCNAMHTKWREFHVQMSDNYGRFCTLASVTGSLYVQMRIQNHLPEDQVWFCILKTLPWGIFERCFPLEYDWAFKCHIRPLLSKHRKTALNKPVSVDEAPEKLPRFTEGLPTLLETLPIDLIKLLCRTSLIATKCLELTRVWTGRNSREKLECCWQ